MTITWLATEPPRRPLRRAVVFFSVFLLALAASLIYVYSRPPEYRAVAELQIVPAGTVTQPTEAKDTPTVTTDAKSFLTQVQVLTSRPLLQSVFDRLRETGPLPDLGRDPIAAMQRMLHTKPVAGTQIVELSAESREQALVAPLVNTVVDAYQQHVADAYKDSIARADGAMKAEVGRFAQEVAAKRHVLDAFRARYDIVSMEHNENAVLAETDGLSRAYAEAKDRLANAQAGLQALQHPMAAGARAKDDPTLAAIEQGASVLREKLQALKLQYTSAYLAINVNAQALQAQLTNLESQIATRRAANARAALAEAQEKVSAAQSTVEKLAQDVANHQKEAQEFATHLNEYKVLHEDLDHIEQMHRAALDRLMKLQASDQERAPRVELIEAATASLTASWPDYRRDALIALAGSLVFGLFAAWLADFIAGPPASPVIPNATIHPAWMPPMVGRAAMIESLPPAATGAAQLPAPAAQPRQLDDAEIAALIAAAIEDAKLAMLALLTGLSTDELVALSWDEIDLSGGIIHVGGQDGRPVLLEEPLRSLLAERRRLRPEDGGRVLHGPNETPLGTDDIERLVQYCAHDAGLDRPQEVSAAALRYTWLSFLLRQGLRAADVSAVAGHVPPRDLFAYMEIHSPKAKQPLDRIDRVLPVLRALGRARAGGTA
jgi:polysaccharide biosynthesis transport protein